MHMVADLHMSNMADLHMYATVSVHKQVRTHTCGAGGGQVIGGKNTNTRTN